MTVEPDTDVYRVTIAEGTRLRVYELGEDGRIVLVAEVNL